MTVGALNKLAAVALSTLLLAMAVAPNAVADDDPCSPPGIASALAPKPLPAPSQAPYEDAYTTGNVVPLGAVDVNALGLATAGTLRVATQGDGQPSACQDQQGRFTGFDNDLLRAVAAKLNLQLAFTAIKVPEMVKRVAAGEFDVGSGSLTSIDSRREVVGFTNGYDFGYNTLVVRPGSKIVGFDDLAVGQRVGVVASSSQAEYVTGTLKLQPITFPDFSTAYSSLKTGQIDAWVAPERQARTVILPGDPAVILGVIPLNRFVAWPVAKEKQSLIDALNAGLDAVIADGTWAKLFSQWVPRPLPSGWNPGSKAAVPQALPDIAVIAAKNAAPPKKSMLEQLGELLGTGLPNTLILTFGAAVIGLLAGVVLALIGSSGSRWLRWPVQIYTDVIQGVPEILVVMLVGLGLGRALTGMTGFGPYVWGIVALGLVTAAYVGEILGSGLRDVGAGRLAALPHTVRRKLPTLLDQLIWLLRASALVYFLGLVGGQRDLFGVGRDLTDTTDSLLPFVAAALCYLVLTVPLKYLVPYLEGRRRPAEPEAEPVRTPAAAASR